MDKKKHYKKFRASGGKQLKKDISRLWKEVAQKIQSGVLPAADVSKELLVKCEDYNLYTHRQWADLWRECCRQIKNCLSSAQEGDFDSALELVNDVNSLTQRCHKLYK